MYVINVQSYFKFLCNIKLLFMKTIFLHNKPSRLTKIQPTPEYFSSTDSKKKKALSSLQRFLNFAENQQPNNYGWLAFSLFFQGCVMAPLTILAIVLNGNNFALWIPCITAIAAIEIVSLSAMPTKITIPVLFAGILTDVIVVIMSFFI